MSEDIANNIRIRFNHAAARKTLEEKYQSKMLFAHSGGMWRAGPELLAVLQPILSLDDAVILDVYNTPVKINPSELHALVLQRWQEQMNSWLVEFDNLRTQR